MKIGKIILIVVGLLVLVVLCVAIGSSGDKGANTGAQEPPPTATPLPILADDFFAIRYNAENMTDAQWDEYVKTIVNTQTTWTGHIVDVKSDGRVSVDMDPPDDMWSTSDCYFSIPQESATQFQKGQFITWTGRVKSVKRFMGMMIDFDNVFIHP